MKLKEFFFILTLALHCDAMPLKGMKQSFEKQATETEVNSGGTAVMDCKVINKGRLSGCMWYKDKRPITFYRGQYEWSGDPTQGDCSLKISFAFAAENDGKWECHVIGLDSHHDLYSEPARLIVRDPIPLEGMKQSFEKQAIETVVNEGDSVVMDCKVINKGSWSSCMWYKDKRPIGPFTGQYWYSGDQKQGDCRINIHFVLAKVDDGLWECLITGFDSHDYHYSEPVRLIVRDLAEQEVEESFDPSEIEGSGAESEPDTKTTAEHVPINVEESDYEHYGLEYPSRNFYTRNTNTYRDKYKTLEDFLKAGKRNKAENLTAEEQLCNDYLEMTYLLERFNVEDSVEMLSLREALMCVELSIKKCPCDEIPSSLEFAKCSDQKEKVIRNFEELDQLRKLRWKIAQLRKPSFWEPLFILENIYFDDNYGIDFPYLIRTLWYVWTETMETKRDKIETLERQLDQRHEMYKNATEASVKFEKALKTANEKITDLNMVILKSDEKLTAKQVAETQLREELDILRKTLIEQGKVQQELNDQSGASKRLVPLFDHILVEKAEPITKARGDILIQQKVLKATVVAVGPGAINRQGQHRPVTVKVGDKVLLAECGGTKVEVEDKEYFLFKENDLISKLES